MRWGTQKICMDLGQESLRIGTVAEGILLAEQNEKLFVPPSVELKPKVSKRPSYPLTSFHSVYDQGLIKDIDGLSGYLSTVLSAIGKKMAPLLAHEVLIAVPATSTRVYKEQLQETLRYVGFSTITLCSVPLAVCVGAGFSLPLKSPVLVVNLGASVSEIGLVMLSECTQSRTLLWTGEECVDRLWDKVRTQFDYKVPRSVVKELVVLYWGEVAGGQKSSPSSMSSTCQELVAHVPPEFWQEHHRTVVSSIASELEIFLQDLTAAQLSSIADHGIILSGGFASLYGLTAYCSAQLKIPVFTLPTSQTLAISGLLKIQELL